MPERVENINIEKGSKVLVRTSLNVPIGNGMVVDDIRLEKSCQTILFLKNKGYKVIVLAHLGREGESLKTVSDEFQRFVSHKFVDQVVGDRVKEAISDMSDGDVLLLENIRSDSREAEKSNEFAGELAELGDVIVFDAFADSHRDHSSISLLPKLLPCYLGILISEEIKTLKQSLSPSSPSLCILGGSKLETKLPLFEILLERYDKVFVGGVLANTLLKYKGFEVGKSVVSDVKTDLSLDFNKLILPKYVSVKRGEKVIDVSVDSILVDDKIVDVGLETIKDLREYIDECKDILWNGPLGIYEKGFNESSVLLAKYLSSSSARSVVGGGDTIGCLRKANVLEDIYFISTGGGAMLDFLAKEGRLEYLGVST